MTSPASGGDLPDYAPVPRSALGPALNDQGYYVGRVERNLYWVTDGVYQSAFLATADGVVLFDAPPSIGGNLRRAVDEIAAANGVPSTVTHLVYSHHHADHAAAASLFGGDVVRIGHEETRRLLLRDGDLARPVPDITFADRYTLEVGGVRVELAWHGPNHSPDNIYIHFPDHDTLMFIDVVNAGWVPIYNLNLSEDVPEVARNDREGVHPHRIGDLGLERAVAVAQQDRYCATKSVRHGEVGAAVAGEVARHDRLRRRSHRVGDRRLEGAVAIAQQHRNFTGRRRFV